MENTVPWIWKKINNQTIGNIDLSIPIENNRIYEENDGSISVCLPSPKTKPSFKLKEPIHRIQRLNKREGRIKKKVLSIILSEGDLPSSLGRITPDAMKYKAEKSKFTSEI